ncbi:dihydroneopterin aldolase [Thiotrichales bacterium 19X7-9]|nr:dihydroneopterin aldolase [Thiotrichales bacterium 19X7-9]
MKISTSLHINGCELYAYLGATGTERDLQQRVLVNIELSFPSLIKACQSDELEDTICYKTLRDLLQNALNERAFNLIEHLGWFLTDTVLTHYPEVTIHRLELVKYPPTSHINEAKFIMTAEA